MLVTTQSQFVEKILLSKDGKPFKVLFRVSFIGGQFKAVIVSAKPLEEHLALPASFPKVISTTSFYNAPVSIPSPFSPLLFFNSQPTRAPSNF